MKQRSDKRISTSFSLDDLEKLCQVLTRKDADGAMWNRMHNLRTKLRARVALAKLRESQACTAIHATNSCEGV